MIDQISLDLQKKGLLVFFKSYQAESLRFLLKKPKSTSRDVYENLLFNADINISRASVINTLNKWVKWGLVAHTEDAGKGGMHRVYSINQLLHTEKDIIMWMYKHIIMKFNKEGID